MYHVNPKSSRNSNPDQTQIESRILNIENLTGANARQAIEECLGVTHIWDLHLV